MHGEVAGARFEVEALRLDQFTFKRRYTPRLLYLRLVHARRNVARVTIERRFHLRRHEQVLLEQGRPIEVVSIR